MDPKTESPPEARKKPYERPQVIELGTVTDLTQGRGGRNAPEGPRGQSGGF